MFKALGIGGLDPHRRCLGHRDIFPFEIIVRCIALRTVMGALWLPLVWVNGAALGANAAARQSDALRLAKSQTSVRCFALRTAIDVWRVGLPSDPGMRWFWATGELALTVAGLG